MLKDLRYALRTLRQNPGFALTAIVSIALGIGANSAIFAVADGMLLRPLPVPNPSNIVSLRSRTPNGNFETVSYPDFLDIRDKNRSFESLVAFDLAATGFAKDATTQPQLKVGLLVSGNFFSALNVQPEFGRAFNPDEDQVPGRDAVIVISQDLWKSELGADPSIIGRKVRLNGLDFAVIGITSESFTGVEHMLRPAFYVPAMMGPSLSPANKDLLKDRSNRTFFVKGRLKPGTSIPAATAEVATIARSLEESYPTTNRATGAAVFTERQERLFFDGPYDDQLVKMLFGLVIIVLSIACANVANLMLSRGRARAREIAVRLAIGAGRSKLVRQLLIESLLISLAGGALGLIIAQAGVTAFSVVQIPSDFPLEFNFRLDYRVATFTVFVSVASAIFFGLVPALQSTKTDLLTALKAGESDDNRKRLFGRRALVVVQIAGSLVLLIAATEIYTGVKGSLAANPGFRVDHRLTMRFAPGAAAYTDEMAERFYKALLEKARQVPGVQSVALSAGLPMTSNAQIELVTPEGFQFRPGQEGVRVVSDYVSDHYFETFAIPMLAGRGFLETDRADSPPVAVVNEAFARRYFNGDPIGKRLRINSKDPWIEVVGMTTTGKFFSVFEAVNPFLYLPYTQNQQARMTLIAETRGDPAAMAGPLREMVRSVDPVVPVYAVRTMDDLFDQRSVKIADLFIGIVGTLGAMGLVLALIGLYAVVAFQVSRKTREIGIRVALGAKRQEVMALVVKYAAGMVVAGIAIGVALSLVGNHFVAVGLTTLGPQVLTINSTWFATAVAALLLTTFAASAIPAWRAARVDPMRALRQD